MGMNSRAFLFYFRYGYTNLWRRKNRTLLLGISFFILATFLVVFLGYSIGISRQMLGKAIDNFLGDVAIISAESKLDAVVNEEVVSFDDTDLRKKIQVHVDLLEIRREYRTECFLYTNNLHRLSYLVGVDENSIERLKIIKGENLNPAYAGSREILLTSLTAETLELDIGDRVSLEVVTPQGFRNIDYFTVKGIYNIPGIAEVMVTHLAISTLRDVQHLMNEVENKVTNVILYAKNRRHAPQVKGLALKVLGTADYKIMDYKEYGNMIVAIMRVFVALGWVVGIISIFIIAVFFFDTMLATLEERKKEYGIMFSLGLSWKKIGLLILSEYAVFALFFVLPGILTGGVIIALLAKVGITVPQTIQSFMGGIEVFSPYIQWGILVKTFLCILGLIELANIYTIIKIKRLNPVEVLKND